MSFIIAGTALAAVGGAYNIVDGANKESAGKKLAEANRRPWYNIPNEYDQNVNLAASQAETGLSPSTMNFYTTNATRGLGSGISGILEGGGDVDNISKLYDQFSQGLSSESAEDQNLKTQHLNTLINANKDAAGQKTQQWALNYYEPFKDTAQLASAEKAGGQQQIGTGMGEITGAAASLSNANLYKERTAALGKGLTMGEKLGTVPMDSPASVGVGNIAGATPIKTDIFGTPGGQAVLGHVSKTDALSPQLQQLIDLFRNTPQSAN